MHVRAKKHLGQHFLRDLDAARRIAEGITKHRGCTDVLEVGPGTGALAAPFSSVGTSMSVPSSSTKNRWST